MCSKERKKYLFSIFNLCVIIWKYTLQYTQRIIKTIKSLRIYNWLSLIAALLGFIGTLFVVMDKFAPIHRKIDQFNTWKNISIALKDLNEFDEKGKGGEFGMIEHGEQGFLELVDIIYSNRPDLTDRYIAAIIKTQPITVSGIPFKILRVVFLNFNTYPLTTEDIFYGWVNNYREKYFLKKGLLLIALGFFLGVLGHLKRKPLIKEGF